MLRVHRVDRARPGPIRVMSGVELEKSTVSMALRWGFAPRRRTRRYCCYGAPRDVRKGFKPARGRGITLALPDRP